jgi:HTH-type transcriptional regulator / antitoxin HigA
MKTRSRRRRSPAKVARAGGAARAGESYLELVHECPLRIIRTEAEYRLAIAVLDRLSDLGPARTEDQTEYLLALALFVEKYERAHEPIPAATGVEMLGYLIETHGVKQGEVAAGAGLADSTVSEILAGKRKMNVKHIGALARFFKVEPAVFLDD